MIDVPGPVIGPTEVLVQTLSSTMSPGTESGTTRFGSSSLVAKARSRPDLVRQLVSKARTDGLAKTVAAVRTKLGSSLPLGYSAAGVALEVGEAVHGVVPGQLVATAGAGKATHAELEAVPGLLCAPVPDGVTAEEASFSTLGSIALHGLRHADVGPASKVVVIGLGLIGQLTLRLARAAGCDVAGIDVAEFPVAKAREAGAVGLIEAGDDTTAAVLEWTRGRGADAVLVTAATPESSVMTRAPALCRDRARIVVVGDVGLHLDRAPFYEREITLQFARSYGPGRYERTYEEWGVDYPPGYVRWTEGRNLEAVMDLVASGRLGVLDLVTHRFPIEEAPRAYGMVQDRSEPYLAIQFTYGGSPSTEKTVRLRRVKATGHPRVGVLGAGSFAKSVLVPAFRQQGFELAVVASASGLSARQLADQAGFSRAGTGAESVLDDPEVDVVVVATPHDSHAELVCRALRAGKHVFCEKPLALTFGELAEVEAALDASPGVLFVGFNRRWSRPVALVRDHFASSGGPLSIAYRVNAGRVAPTHWYRDRRHGGRLLGEVCHFVDTCSAIVAEQVTDVRALAPGRDELLLTEDVAVALRFADGSLACINYASAGHPSTGKERIEVLGRGHSAVVDNFSEVVLDGTSVHKGRDMGHDAEITAFRAALRDGTDTASTFLASTRATLLAASALTGLP